MESSIRDLIQGSITQIESEIQNQGFSATVRHRLRKMAIDGDLHILSLMVDRYMKVKGDGLLNPGTPVDQIDLLRGQISGLRDFWSDLLGDGELEEEEEMTSPAKVPHPMERLTQEDVRPFDLTADI